MSDIESAPRKKRRYDVEAWIQFHLLRLTAFHPETTKADVAVMAEVIQRYHGDHGNGWASHQHLGDMAGISRATVIRCKRNLERLGFVSVLQAGRRGSATVYLPNFTLIPKKGIMDDTQTLGITDATLIDGLGITDDTETPGLGITDATPFYLPDRPTRAVSQVDRIEPAGVATPPPGTAPVGADQGASAVGDFDDLWRAYSHRHNKAAARAEWDRLAPSPELAAAIIASAKAWYETWKAQANPDARRYGLPRWLRDEKWDENPPGMHGPAKRTRAKPAAAAPGPDTTAAPAVTAATTRDPMRVVIEDADNRIDQDDTTAKFTFRVLSGPMAGQTFAKDLLTDSWEHPAHAA